MPSEAGVVARETPDHHFVIGSTSLSADGDFIDFPNDGNGNYLLMKINGTNVKR